MSRNASYFDAGIVAYDEGRDIRDNEYTPGSLPWREWRAGWIVAAIKATHL